MRGLDAQHLSPEEIDMLVNGLVPEQTTAQEPELDDHTEKIAVHSVRFAPFEQKGEVKQSEKRRMELLYDVPLQLSVELGRTMKSLREILNLSPGALIELNKSAGESLDVLANGRVIAVGEVMVLDENYGIRIKGILNANEMPGKVNNQG
ncbi:MAG: flagellar motor switch protein FliN [Syntrophaceticus sp.]|nr:flagellar motor switch protein FliN [Syntrophaceticus sp.]MDD4783742.1 flagellar motor switch protein FliN [Syntrophaceticus sp.]